MIKTSCILLTLGAILCGSVSSEAQVLKNGDFSNGLSHWGGPGKLVHINDAGEPTDPKDGGQPALEVKLSKQSFKEVHQRFVPVGDLKSFEATAEVMTSSDFKRNDASQQYTKEIEWVAGGWYSWSKRVFPKVDFAMRVDANSHYHYAPRNLKTGGSWQRIKGSFKTMKPKGPKVFTLMFPPGEGTVWVKSITTTGP